MIPLICLEDFFCRSPRCEHPVLQGLNLKVARGDFLLCGGTSGSGKSTLAQFLGGVLEIGGPVEITGRAYFDGVEWSQLDRGAFCRRVASVWQHPERQMLAGSVEEEIVYGLEQLGEVPSVMRRRLAEVTALLGCAHLLGRHPASLSGGEQQRVALAAAVAQGRDMLILDEPTAQLDPVAAESLLGALQQLHQDFALTILLIENRLSSALPLADHVLFLDKGRATFQGSAAEFLAWTEREAPDFLPEIPAWFRERGLPERPFTLNQARRHLVRQSSTETVTPPSCPPSSPGFPVLEVRELSWAYHKNQPVLDNLSLRVLRGEIFCLLGENGAGKSTLLRILLHALHPKKPHIFWQGQPGFPPASAVGYLPQRAGDLLWADTVAEEWAHLPSPLPRHLAAISSAENPAMDRRHPRDLGSGEQQLLAVALTLGRLTDPAKQLLLADEPSRGLDPMGKRSLAQSLRDFTQEGGTVLLISQDIDWAATVADRVGLIFQGEMVAEGQAAEFWAEGLFYAPMAARLARVAGSEQRRHLGEVKE